MTEADFDRIFAINVKAIFLMTARHGAAVARAGGGVILNIGSTAGIRPRPGLTWYNGSKGAVNLISQSMAVELAPDKIRVNCISPVMGATGCSRRSWACPTRRRTGRSSWRRSRSAGCRRPIDVAAPRSIFASDEAEFISGVVLEVDGGRTI